MEAEDRAQGEERKRVGRQGRGGETDMEPKPPSESTPKKDRDLFVTAESPTRNSVSGTEKVFSRCLRREGKSKSALMEG